MRPDTNAPVLLSVSEFQPLPALEPALMTAIRSCGLTIAENFQAGRFTQDSTTEVLQFSPKDPQAA